MRLESESNLENFFLRFSISILRLNPSDILVRMGEHDLGSNGEPHPHVDSKVKTMFMHPRYNPRTSNDIGKNTAD